VLIVIYLNREPYYTKYLIDLNLHQNNCFHIHTLRTVMFEIILVFFVNMPCVNYEKFVSDFQAIVRLQFNLINCEHPFSELISFRVCAPIIVCLIDCLRLLTHSGILLFLLIDNSV